MIYPNALQKGDIVMVIAPSGPPTLENILKGVNVLQEMGLSVIIGKSVYEKYGYLAKSDQVRLDDIHEAFTNTEVKAVFCARGGYGSARLLPYIQYEIIQRNPKIFWGYSDITALHTAFSRYAELVTFHGPMIEELGKGINSLFLIFFQSTIPSVFIYLICIRMYRTYLSMYSYRHINWREFNCVNKYNWLAL